MCGRGYMKIWSDCVCESVCDSIWDVCSMYESVREYEYENVS